MMPLASAFFLDTNVLLDATVPSRTNHVRVTNLLRSLPGVASLCISGQVVREYVGVCTRPRSANGLGLSTTDSLTNSRAFLRITSFLEETSAVTQKWIDLVENYGVSGKQVHDACIVATMLVHGVTNLVTANLSDFRRYQGLIEPLSPEQVDINS